MCKRKEQSGRQHTGQGTRGGGRVLVSVPEVAGSAQLGARLERQEPTWHARPTSERPPAAREDNIAVAIVQGNSESA